MNSIIRKLINRKYSLTIGVFVAWMLLFDGNSAMFIYKQYHELKDLRMQEQFLKEEIADMEEQKVNLFSTNDRLEKYAREHYFFKKDDEDVFVLAPKD